MTSVNVTGGGVPSVSVSGNQVIASASSGQVSASVSVGPFVQPSVIPEPPAGGSIYGRSGGQWRPLAIPGYSLVLSDVANTSGDIAGSKADTGQDWLVTGSGAVPPKKPFYSSDEIGGYMRATTIEEGVSGAYIYAVTGGICTRLAVKKRGMLATLSLLKTDPFDPSDMIHVNFWQDTGAFSAIYWKTGAGPGGGPGIAISFRYNFSQGFPESDPTKPRLYEIEVVDQHVIGYIDGQFVGIASDPVVPGLLGTGFYAQLHDREDRIYEIRAWNSDPIPSLGEHATVTSLLKSRHAVSRSLHVGNEGSSNYSPNTNYWIQANSPTFRSDGTTLNALFQATGTNIGATLALRNSGGVGVTLEASGNFSGSIKHNNSNRIEFPWAISRVDFPVAVKARSVAHVVALTYGVTVATDAAAGDVFDLTLTGAATLSNPTNPINGKTLTWRILQDANGGHAVTLGDKFAIPSTITSPLPWEDTANTLTILSATYHLARDKWDIVAFNTEY